MTLTQSDLINAVTALQDATSSTRENFSAIEAWGSQLGQVEFIAADKSVHQARTLKQIDIDSASSALVAQTAWEQASGNIETKDQATYRGAVEAASAGKNSVFWDAQGNANVMVWINKFNSEDVNAAILAVHGVDLQLGTGTFPAFIKDGIEIRGFWYGKYQASSGLGGGCSVIAGVQPKTSINYDQARDLCINKGANWHMATNLEWCAVSYLSMAFGAEVRGNTNHGRSHSAKHEVSRRVDILAPGDTAGTGRTDCGTGPSTWSHDGTIFGVFDLVGNVWEWVDSLLLKDGRVVSAIDNNPFLPEINWTNHNAYLDSSAATAGSVILNSSIVNRVGALGDDANAGNSSSNVWATTSKDVSYVESALMRQMAIESASIINLGGTIYSRNFGERAPFRGGHWGIGSIAGLGALNFNNSRTIADSGIGFRPALFES
jgi:hypothetical protein